MGTREQGLIWLTRGGVGECTSLTGWWGGGEAWRGCAREGGGRGLSGGSTLFNLAGDERWGGGVGGRRRGGDVGGGTSALVPLFGHNWSGLRKQCGSNKGCTGSPFWAPLKT